MQIMVAQQPCKSSSCDACMYQQYKMHSFLKLMVERFHKLLVVCMEFVDSAASMPVAVKGTEKVSKQEGFPHNETTKSVLYCTVYSDPPSDPVHCS